MGKATAMDVSHTETLTEFHWGLWSIVLLVFVAHAWQVFNGVFMFVVLVEQLRPLETPWYNFREELQCAALGTLFIFLGVTNCVVTVQTLLEKGERQRGASLRRAGVAVPQTQTPTVAASACAGAASAAAAPPLRAASCDSKKET